MAFLAASFTFVYIIFFWCSLKVSNNPVCALSSVSSNLCVRIKPMINYTKHDRDKVTFQGLDSCEWKLRKELVFCQP